MKSSRQAFLETSGIYHAFHGDRRMKTAVKAVLDGKSVWISNYVRMEYLSGVIYNLIKLYFLIKDEETVHDALAFWTQSHVNQQRKHILVILTISNFLTTQEGVESKHKTLKRLGEYIINLSYFLDQKFPRKIKDDLNCQLGKIGFADQPFNEDMLLEFVQKYDVIYKGTPSCGLCVFKEKKRRDLSRNQIDLCSKSQQDKYEKNKGYVTQAKRLEKVLEQKSEKPSCYKCRQLGDSIIANHLRLKRNALFVTADRGFEAFGEILNFEVHLLLSAKKLKDLENETT